MANVEQIEAYIERENDKDSGVSLEKNLQVDPGRVKHRRNKKVISSSASAHDLRLSDIEKEMRDQTSPKGVLEACLGSFECNPDSPDNDSMDSPVRCTNSGAISGWRKYFEAWRKRTKPAKLRQFASFPPVVVPKQSKQKIIRDNPVLRDLYSFKSSLQNFTLSELQAATDNFSEENLIGKGGYAKVYRGRLKDGNLVAVKQLNKGTPDERTADFLSELGIIAHVNHPNTAKLVGCGIEGGMHLVFKLSALGSLGSILHGRACILDWSKRYKIALGTADGLTYLHENCQRRIIHRDIKADNILLTDDFEPQICDFGLAKWLPDKWTHHNVSKFEGTFGYFAPEYFMHGIVDEKTDVYAFGVLLLELITGRRALDHLQQSLVLWAKPLLDNDDIRELVDPSLGNKYDTEELDRMILTASLCIEQSPILRPRMSQVVILLKGDEYALKHAHKGPRKSLQRTFSEELMDVQEYNSTKYLNDIKRLREIALG